MSLIDFATQDGANCFPRVSGDEPMSMQAVDDAVLFSPRERG